MQVRRQVNRMVFWITLSVLALSVAKLFADGNEKHSFKSNKGFVPDKITATRIAEAVLTPIYGENRIKNQHPLTATLRQGVWTVKGSIPKGLKGGVAIVELSKEDARIIRVSHGK